MSAAPAARPAGSAEPQAVLGALRQLCSRTATMSLLELAQALVSRPRLLVLDEPTIGLDPLARAGIWDRVLELRAEQDMTVLLTTHYMEEAEQLCDRVGLLLNGHLRAVGLGGSILLSRPRRSGPSGCYGAARPP